MPCSFIIDTDTASDDAVALLMALRHPDVRVEAITVVAGNVELERPDDLDPGLARVSREQVRLGNADRLPQQVVRGMDGR